MKLEDFGYNEKIEKLRNENDLQEFEIGRVIAEHKERYIVKTEKGDFEAEITGNLRFSAISRKDYPAVGDWVALMTYDSDFAVIHKIIPRVSIISRQAVGLYGEIQIIATNIDFGLIVQSLDRDFNINRIERYLTICYSSKVTPIIILTKTDLIDEHSLKEIIDSINLRLSNIPLIAVSNITNDGYDALKKVIQKGKTYCLLGSSGVGKSTIINSLSGKSIMKTGSISESTSKGKHITSHRELIILESGGILIDNPGMREVGIVDHEQGLETTFDLIFSLAENCRFNDCTHTSEKGCAVIEALENGKIDSSVYENFKKLQREKSFFETSELDKRKKDKIFGKILKDYLKKDVKGKNF